MRSSWLFFFPKSNPSKNYTFGDLAKIKGNLLRGEDTYEMYKAKQAARPYNVLVPMIDKDSTYTMPFQIRVIPVELVYRIAPPGKLKEESGIPFDYEARRYVLHYVDDWDVIVEKVNKPE